MSRHSPALLVAKAGGTGHITSTQITECKQPVISARSSFTSAPRERRAHRIDVAGRSASDEEAGRLGAWSPVDGRWLRIVLIASRALRMARFAQMAHAKRRGGHARPVATRAVADRLSKDRLVGRYYY